MRQALPALKGLLVPPAVMERLGLLVLLVQQDLKALQGLQAGRLAHKGREVNEDRADLSALSAPKALQANKDRKDPPAPQDQQEQRALKVRKEPQAQLVRQGLQALKVRKECQGRRVMLARKVPLGFKARRVRKELLDLPGLKAPKALKALKGCKECQALKDRKAWLALFRCLLSPI